MSERKYIDSGKEDRLILVDGDDRVLGYESKERCHCGEGILHRAFSIFIFNSQGQLILQRRSRYKWLWPMFWSNSVCSHPRQGEEIEPATHRRLLEEIGIDGSLQYLFKFQYQAQFQEVGSENELCSVYIGKSDQEVTVDPREIDQWRYIGVEELDREIVATPGQFTPWFKIEWARIREEHMAKVRAL